MTRIHYAWLTSTFLLAGFLHAQSVDLQVELMNQIGTDTSRKGDLISGRVVTPQQFQGDMLEGKITESKSGAKLGGQSAFAFSFDTLKHGGTTIPIQSQFKSVMNSKGKPNVDEEGRMVRRGTGNVAKAAGGTGAGALIGGLAGGGKGAAIGAAVGAGASILLIQVAADGPNIRFAAGSKMIIETKTRDGSSLMALPAPAQPAPAPAPVTTATAPAAVAAPSPVSAAAPPQDAQPPAVPAASPQPEMTALKSTFVPGEKTLFYDDFTDMSADDAPPHFKVRGAAPQLMAAGNIRELTVTVNGSISPNLTTLPKNFTYEGEVKMNTPKRVIQWLNFYNKNSEILQLYTTIEAAQLDLVVSLRKPYSELGRKRLPMSWNDTVKFALWVQNGRLRVFVNGEKQLDFNQVEMPDLDRVEFIHSFNGAGPQSWGFRSVRFAESTPDFSQVISASGRFVTHGIQFDTDSDRLKPESAPVIQSIAKGLETNPNLKLKIEGYTDSVGDANHNLDLSRRRAEAVKSVLTAQFKVDESRLATAGMGPAKPIDSNDTPQGRAQNRRVEFVKQ